jgi:5,10-methylene-tetrahydrofolate dehydrogenase/methenyl tetrahydrofolate cyclohydrolase
LKEEIKEKNWESPPLLSVVIVGDRKDSEMYVRMKAKTCRNLGMMSEIVKLPMDVTQDDLITIIEGLNRNTDGILVQLPLPDHIDSYAVMDAIDPSKDVDGLHPYNIGKVALLGDKAPFVPCTPKGCLEMLDRYDIPVEGKHCVVIGASNVVGKPLALLLLARHATVTVCHKKTVDTKSHSKMADILFVATGKAHLIKRDWVKPGAVVIDIGTSIVLSKKGKRRVVGDVDTKDVMDVVSAISPVPGGVGPMTIAMLMKNTVEHAVPLSERYDEKCTCGPGEKMYCICYSGR